MSLMCTSKLCGLACPFFIKQVRHRKERCPAHIPPSTQTVHTRSHSPQAVDTLTSGPALGMAAVPLLPIPWMPGLVATPAVQVRPHALTQVHTFSQNSSHKTQNQSLSSHTFRSTPPSQGALLAVACFGFCDMIKNVAKEAQAPTFLPVTQAVSRRVAFHTFAHVLSLDVSFHLDKRTGRLSRILERGRGQTGLGAVMLSVNEWAAH